MFLFSNLFYFVSTCTRTLIIHAWHICTLYPPYFQGSMSNGMNGGTGYSAISSMDRLAIEPEKIKRWREDNAKMLEEKGKLYLSVVTMVMVKLFTFQTFK